MALTLLLSTVLVPPIGSLKAKIASSFCSVKMKRRPELAIRMEELDFSRFGNLRSFRSGGTGVLERPSFDQSLNDLSPQAEAG